MAYEIQDKISVLISFNGKEFPFDRVNTFGHLHISSSCKLAVPMLTLALTDNISFLSTNGSLADGSKISIKIRSSSESTQSDVFEFRLNSFVSNITPTGRSYTIDAYLDVVNYWHSSSTTSFLGSSYDCLANLATNCNLTFKGDYTSDTQRWICRNLPNFEWARQIAERGYRSETSCMQLALTASKQLLYRDITTLSAPTTKISLIQDQAGFITATDYAPVTSSGSSNHMSGYFSKLIKQNSSVAPYNSSLSKVNLTNTSAKRSLQVNADIHNGLNSGNTRFSPINVGNVHDTFEDARYQNRRIGALYSAKVSVLLKDRSGLDPLDPVSLYADINSYENVYSGDYVVISKAVVIRGSDYVEKLEIARKEMNQSQPTSVSNQG